MLARTLVGVLGSGEIGYDPFDRKSWSGISYYLFTNLRGQGALHRAFGVEVPTLRKRLMMLANFHPDRSVWKMSYYMNPSYREALTDVIDRHLVPEDRGHDALQIGAMYDVPRLLAGRSRCFSYHDGNLACSLKSPYAPAGLSTRRIDAGLAFERKVYHGIDRIFAMSEYLRRSFTEDYGVPPERVSNIGAGVNLDTIPEPVPGKRHDTKAVLFLGADFTRKGGPQLLEAFRRVREVHPDATLHIVGPRSLSIAPQQEGGVHFHGYLSKTDPTDKAKLDELFENCSLFVLPSLYEPFGIAPLEAMVHQIPAVVSRAWALEETVTPGQTGEHVEPGSVDDLVDRLRALLGDPQRLREMGEAGREFALRRHTWPAVVQRMVEEIAGVQEGCLPGVGGASKSA
jgi:glycosyltransferase involved in cell wall biosynthesis